MKSEARIDTFHAAWEKTRQPMVIVPNDEAAAISNSWPSTWVGETYTLFERNMLDVFRDSATIIATVAQALVISLLMGFLFWDVGLNAEGDFCVFLTQKVFKIE